MKTEENIIFERLYLED